MKMKAVVTKGKLGFDHWMRDKLYWSHGARSLTFYYLEQFQEQVLAVVPVTLCLVITLGEAPCPCM